MGRLGSPSAHPAAITRGEERPPSAGAVGSLAIGGPDRRRPFDGRRRWKWCSSWNSVHGLPLCELGSQRALREGAAEGVAQALVQRFADAFTDALGQILPNGIRDA